MIALNKLKIMISYFSDKEIDEQMLMENEHCVLVLPRNPIYPFHFMITPKRKEAHIFTELTAEELVDMQSITKQIVKSFQGNEGFHYSGYNLFCNNGSAQASQHVNQFHMHMFVRSLDEEVSPYDLLNQNKRWVNKDTDEWKEHRDKMRKLLS